MSRILPSYLSTLRKQRGLSQPDLAQLLDISASLLCKVESLARRPTARVILPAEIVFGIPAREIFPGAYSEIEHAIGQRARQLLNRLEKHSDPASVEKRRLIKEIIARLGQCKKAA